MKLSSLLLAASLLFASALKANINYNYYEGSWSTLPDLTALTAVKSGTSSSLDLSVRNREQNYAILWTGYITIPANGTYTFETNSDDGSMVYIGSSNALLVNNDGQHGEQIKTGSIYLNAGVYPVKIAYMNACCSGVMQLYWSSNIGISRQLVPASAFSGENKQTQQTSTIAPLATAPASTGAGLDYNYYEGSLTSLSDLSSLKVIKTGSSTNIDLGVRNREVNYIIVWNGYLTIPANGTYTFETNSDDGSMIYLGSSNALLVNNDGQHGEQIRTGSFYLEAGIYPIKIAYMNACCAGVMQLYWSSNTGISRQLVPASAFSHQITAITQPNPVVTTPVVGGTSDETGGLTSTVNYYFSSSTGDDSRSALQAQDASTPWKTLAKLNSVMTTARPGTAFLLRRGDVFEGALYVSATGSSSNYANSIIVSAYGSGNKPVISGFASSANWTSLGNGVWEAALSTSIAKMNIVMQNNQIQPMGRYPNITDANRGYLTFEGHSGISTIVDNQLPGFPNWTGAELVIRKNRWTIDRGTVTYHSGNVITQADASGMEPIDGFGYFIQNDPRTLDQLGEWYYNRSTKKVQIYTGGASPAAYGFKPSVIDTLVTIRSKSFITLDNISVQGANSYAMAIWDNANNVTVQNCSIDFSGINGIAGNFMHNFSLLNSTVNHTNNNGLYLAPYCWNAVIKNNTIKNTGLIPGLGSSNNQAHEGMTVDGAGSLIQYNTVDSTGYIAIAFTRDSVKVINNFVNNFTLTTDDGAGIYTHDKGYFGRQILNNIIMNGKGAGEGTDALDEMSANGVGLDDYSTNVEISGNSVANCNGRGIGLHNSQNIILKDNTAFNNNLSQMQFDHDMLGADSPIRGINMQSNILVSKKANQSVFTISTKDNDANQFGTANNNYYCRPIDDKLTINMISYAHTGGMYTTTYDLAHWKSFSSTDANSLKSPVALAPYTVANVSNNMFPNAGFDANIKNVVNFASDRNRIQYDNTVLDGGALKVSYVSGSTSNYNAIWFYDNTNPWANPTLLAGHTYRVKFSVKSGSNSNTDFMITLQSATGNGSPETKTFKVYNTRQEVELLFTPAANVPTAYVSIWNDAPTTCPVYWIDNMMFQEVYSVNYTNPEDHMRFEYNAGTSAKTISLDGVYTDAKNNTYSNSITLAPYSSAVLFKNASSLVQSVDQNARMNTTSQSVQESVSAPVMASSVKISPNPAASQMQFSHGMQVSKVETGVLSVYDMSGKAVKQMNVQVSSQALTVVVSDLKAGVYSVKLDVGSKSTSARFVKL